MSTQGIKSAAINTVTQPAAIQSRMNFNPKKCDPIPMTEKMDLTASPNIKNNGESLYSFGTFSIVDTYETSDEKQRSYNEDLGYGPITNTEAYIVMECTFDDYQEDDWYYEDEYFYDYDYVYSDPEYAYLMEYGEMVDTGTSCSMVLPEGMGDMLTQEQMEAAAQDFGPEVAAEADAEMAAAEAEREADMEAALEEKLELPEGSQEAEGDTQPTAVEAEADAPAATTTAVTPSTEPVIESSINLTSQFSEATSPPAAEARPELDTPAPPRAPSASAANNQNFQLSA